MAFSRKKPARKAAKPVWLPPEQRGEKCLHFHCQQWLVKSGLWNRLLIFHVANERKGGIGAAMHFKRMGVRPGVADYLMFKPGRFAMAIELKDEDGKQREDQEQFQRQWGKCDFGYEVIRTLEDFQALVQAFALFA